MGIKHRRKVRFELMNECLDIFHMLYFSKDLDDIRNPPFNKKNSKNEMIKHAHAFQMRLFQC